MYIQTKHCEVSRPDGVTFAEACLALCQRNRQHYCVFTRDCMTKRVVFAGAGQAKALAKAYRLDVALDTDEDVFFIGVESVGRDAARKVISAADVLVTDLAADGPSVPDDMISVGTLRIAVPVAVCDFLWPFASGPHPRNTYVPGLPDGPYPAGFGDSWLDAMAADGVDEDTAIARYLALDIAAAGGLDGALQASLGMLARLDAATGFDLADFIDDRFRKQSLFTTRDRFALPLFRHVAARLFGQMGVSGSRISLLSDTYFPSGSMPIHPGVLAHFGIEQPGPDYRYPVLDEGFFTFEQYCRSYLRFEYNKLLHAAIAKADSNPGEAIPQLRLALETSPDSHAGQRALDRAERVFSDSSMLPPLALSSSAALRRPPPAATVAPPTPVTPPAKPEAEPDTAAPPAARSEPTPPPPAAATPGLVPRAAFGSSLVGRGQRALEPDDDDDEAAAADSSHATVPVFGLTAWQRPNTANFVPGENETAIPLSLFPGQPETTAPTAPPSINELLPEPQSYVELPLTPFEPNKSMSTSVNMPMTLTDRYKPLAPADHLIPLLPRMLPNTRKMAEAADKPFSAMPESMPPPPLRPVLPPELHPEPIKSSLLSKIFRK
jgi:hypothetical protein